MGKIIFYVLFQSHSNNFCYQLICHFVPSILWSISIQFLFHKASIFFVDNLLNPFMQLHTVPSVFNSELFFFNSLPISFTFHIVVNKWYWNGTLFSIFCSQSWKLIGRKWNEKECNGIPNADLWVKRTPNPWFTWRFSNGVSFIGRCHTQPMHSQPIL